jgi:hypothetical protein
MKNKEKISRLEYYIEESKLNSVKNEKELMSKYNELFELYHSNDDLESVKRSLFLQWYAVSEPLELTGMPDFDESIQRSNLKRIGEIIKNNNYDDEMIYMLKHYYEITEWYFSGLGIYLNKINENKSRNSYKKRGVMGVYWESITNLFF